MGSACAVEHLFSILVHIPECLERRDEGLPCDFLRLYIRRSHAFLFSSERAAAYSTWLGVAIVAASELGTFAWNFNDVFVIVVSGALASRLAALNRHVASVDLQAWTPARWAQLRHAYAAMSALVKMVDTHICSIVFLSFFSNLYFICLQLLNGLSPKSSSALDYLYFFGSFAYLVGRTVVLTLTAARVHDESRLALPTLYQCPAAAYCLE
ncbi:Gustatory receptor for sugar taste 64e, partial [Gryllus bimaculatus]